MWSKTWGILSYVTGSAGIALLVMGILLIAPAGAKATTTGRYCNIGGTCTCSGYPYCSTQTCSHPSIECTDCYCAIAAGSTCNCHTGA
jgi:hypothetical protein